GGVPRAVPQREELRPREPGGTEARVGGAQDALGRRTFVGAREERAHAREDRGRGFARELLVDDRLGERAEDAGGSLEVEVKGANGVDHPGERDVGRAQVLDRYPWIEAERAVAVEEPG